MHDRRVFVDPHGFFPPLNSNHWAFVTCLHTRGVKIKDATGVGWGVRQSGLVGIQSHHCKPGIV